MQGALLIGIVCVFVFAWRNVMASFAEGSKNAISGSLLASMNTASEYGFGAVIAALPGFLAVATALKAIPNPLVNEAVSVTALAGIRRGVGRQKPRPGAMADVYCQRNAAGTEEPPRCRGMGGRYLAQMAQ